MYMQWSEQCLGVDSPSTMFLEIMSGHRAGSVITYPKPLTSCLSLLLLLSSLFVLYFFKAGILVIFLKVSLNIHAEIFVIEHYMNSVY